MKEQTKLQNGKYSFYNYGFFPNENSGFKTKYVWSNRFVTKEEYEKSKQDKEFKQKFEQEMKG